ncbi:MAG: class I adenylate-forming enzyme family protein [Thermomicrobiales bacterium]
MSEQVSARVEYMIDEHAARRPDHTALIFENRSWTYARLRAEVDRRAALLVATGLQPGDVVATTVPPCDDVAIAFFACCRADLTFLSLSPTLATVEQAALLARAGTRLVLTADGWTHPVYPGVSCLPLALPGTPDVAAMAEAAHRSATGDAEAIAIIQPTSGTTGVTPKLVQTPHRTLTWLRATPIWWASPMAVHYYPYPALFAVRGVCDGMWQGGTIVLSQATEPQRMEAEMAARGVTALGTVPAVVRLLGAQRRPPRRLALVVIRTVAATLPPVVQRAAERRYGATIVQEYACTEGGALLGTTYGGAPEGSIGRPYPGVTVRLVDEEGADVADGAIGELIVRSPGMMHGYLDSPAATARTLRDGWLWTGDLAHRDAHGFYFLEGRRALRINVGGHKVAPEEVEAVLEQHPSVREAAVVGAVDAVRGEVVRAVIVSRGEPPSARELRRFCHERLAGYKVPRYWEFRDDLPRSPLGKVLRQQL